MRAGSSGTYLQERSVFFNQVRAQPVSAFVSRVAPDADRTRWSAAQYCCRSAEELAMKRRTLLTVLAALPLVVHAQVPLKTDSLTSALKNPLMGALTSQLGV